jgi:hypothetical protein
MNSTHRKLKMASLVMCNICKQMTEVKNTVLCSTCKNNFEFDCIGYSEKLHRLRDLEKRKNWKCNQCEKRKNIRKTIINNSGSSNVTKRKKQSTPKMTNNNNSNKSGSSTVIPAKQIAAFGTEEEVQTNPQESTMIHSTPNVAIPARCCDSSSGMLVTNISTNNTFEGLADESDKCLDQERQHTIMNCTLHRSCPELNTCDGENSEELKIMLNKLEATLASAHKEIELLISEKYAMAKQITGYQAKIKQLTFLCKASATSGKQFNRINQMGEVDTAQQIHEDFVTNHVPESELSGSADDEKTVGQLGDSASGIDSQGSPEKSPIICEEGLVTLSAENRISAGKKEKSKVIILADQQGRGVRQLLQGLLGSQYELLSFWKPGATIFDILASCKSDQVKLTKNDYIVVIGFGNDASLFAVRHIFASWLSSVRNTNVIVCETPLNRHLNENKLNYEIRFICSQFDNAVFLDMDFARSVPRRKYYVTNLCRNVLREILRLHNYRKFYMYRNEMQNKHMYDNIRDVGTQTDGYDKSRDMGTQTEFVDSTEQILQVEPKLISAIQKSESSTEGDEDVLNLEFFRN